MHCSTRFRSGPTARDLAIATMARMFLPRNARVGFDFLRRKTLRDQRVAAAKKQEQEQTQVKPQANGHARHHQDDDGDVVMMATNGEDKAEVVARLAQVDQALDQLVQSRLELEAAGMN